MRAPGTATTAGFSFYQARGNPWAARRSRRLRRLVSSYTAHGACGSVTADRGASGAGPLERAGSADAATITAAQ